MIISKEAIRWLSDTTSSGNCLLQKDEQGRFAACGRHLSNTLTKLSKNENVAYPSWTASAKH